MALKNLLFIYIILQILYIKHTECSKLNVPRVLLPIFNKFSINFTLEVTDEGCYKWSTSREDIVQITPIYTENDPECSKKAIVSSISKENMRNTAIVLAEEKSTGHVLRCDVIVDIISSLDIVTTTKELYMEEAPEAFEVRAYDDQGNEFTTLENVQFDWAIKCTGSDNSDLSVLRFMTFRDSPYETPKSVAFFEEMGLRGHIVLLEGIKTGSAKISVKLPYSEYSEVKIAEVSLMVVANLIIEPSDVYLVRGDVIQYKITQVRQGKLEKIELLNSQYYLKVADPKIGEIEPQTGIFTALNEGRTQIILYDRNVYDNSELKLPSTNIFVTYPSRVVLNLLPHRNWATIIGQEHEIIVEMFAKNDHKIYMGNEIKFETVVDEKFFPVDFLSKNGTWVHGLTKNIGTSLVKTKLTSITSKNVNFILEPILSATAEILIFSEINIEPNEVMLTWDPQIQPKYELQFNASGGDQKYVWTSSNLTLGSISQSGFVHTYSLGQFEVCAHMARNLNNKKCAKIYILAPEKLQIYEYTVENEIGTPIFLHVALFAKKSTKTKVLDSFSHCDKLNFKVTSSQTNFIYNKTLKAVPKGIACKTIGIIGLASGTAKISVSYTSNGKILEDNITISAYEPLKVLFPENLESTLALKTSRNLIFNGGPQIWLGRQKDHVYNFEINSSKVISIEDMTNFEKNHFYVAKITCEKIGESTVILQVSNKPLCKNCVYHVSTAKVVVYCSEPAYITLKPSITHHNNLCPMLERIVVQNYKKILLDIIVQDDFGRKFDNITTLKLNWSIKPQNTTLVTQNIYNSDIFYNDFVLPGKIYQEILPFQHTGSIEINVKITGYNFELINFIPIQTKINLFSVNDTKIEPDLISIFNHPKNLFYIDVNQGSGFYELSLNSPNIADVKYLEKKRKIEIRPQNVGELHINVKDLCLLSKPATAILNIVSIASIDIQMPDKVEFLKSITAIVRFYDNKDNLLPLPNLEYLNLSYIVEDDLISIKQLDFDPKWGVGEVHYQITGTEIGETQLVFSSGDVVSNPQFLQVFSPLKLSPKNVTLFIGCNLQISINGGPSDLNIEYLVQNSSVVQVLNNGLIKSLNLGHTRIFGRAVSIYTKDDIYSEDFIDIYVKSLIGIKIITPLQRFMVGSTIPIWLGGIPDFFTPILIGSVFPPLKIDWFYNCDNIKLIGLFENLGVTYKHISIRAKALKSGKCTIFANLTVENNIFNSQLDLETFDELELVAPKICLQNIIMAPFSTFQLTTNLQNEYKLTYVIQEHFNVEEKSISVLNTLISVSETGLIQTFGNLGRVMLIISIADNLGLRQSISVIIEVKSVHYILTTVNSNWLLSKPQKYLPLGAEILTYNTFHDNIGQQFHAANLDIKFKSNRGDINEIKKTYDGFVIYPLKSGSAVTKLWIETPQNIDYLNIISENEKDIYNLITGDVFCLKSTILDKNMNNGTWHADQNGILFINKKTGVGQIITDKKTVGSAFYSLTSASKIHFYISPIKELFFKNKPSYITSAKKVTKIPFLLVGNTNKTSNLMTDCDVTFDISYFPFTCHIINFDFDIFDIEPSFDGHFSCDLINLESNSFENSIIESNLTVAVKLENGKTFELENIAFRPAIYINTDYLIFSDTNLDGYLTISGLPDILTAVKVTAMDENILEVSEPHFLTPNTMKIGVSLVDYHWKFAELKYSLTLTVVSKLTDENVKVTVRTMLGSEFNAKAVCAGQFGHNNNNFFYSYRHFITISLSMLIIFFLTVYAYAHYIQPVINVNVGSRTLNMSRMDSPVMLHSTPNRFNKTFPCSNYPNRSNSQLNTTINSLSSTRFGDISQDMNRSFNTTDIRRNRRFL